MDGSVKLPLIDTLTFRPRADFDYKRRPVILLDGEVHYVEDLRAELTGSAAFIIGTDQQSFEQVCRFLNVPKAAFYEMRVPDLSALRHIGGLTDLAIIWNTKATGIDVLADLAPLRSLVLENTPKITDLSPIASHKSLKAIGFRGDFGSRSSKNTAQSLAPLAGLKSLVELSLINLTVIENGLRPIAHCQGLDVLDVSNQFETEDYAFLKANLPHTTCALFAPHIDCEIKNMDGAITYDTAITGLGKPYLLRKTDGKRIAKYERQFEKMYQDALAALTP